MWTSHAPSVHAGNLKHDCLFLNGNVWRILQVVEWSLTLNLVRIGSMLQDFKYSQFFCSSTFDWERKNCKHWNQTHTGLAISKSWHMKESSPKMLEVRNFYLCIGGRIVAKWNNNGFFSQKLCTNLTKTDWGSILKKALKSYSFISKEVCTSATILDRIVPLSCSSYIRS